MTENVEPRENSEILQEFRIRRATAEEAQIVWGIIETCAKWLSQRGLEHWARYYTKDMVDKMIKKKDVFLALSDGKPVGTITTGSNPPKYYNEAGYAGKFTNPEDPAVYITAVAVLPAEHKRGFAGQMLQYIEDEAYLAGADWLRLDCRAEVPGLVGFYEKRGFVKLGSSPVDEGEDGTYWLMEKKIAKA